MKRLKRFFEDYVEAMGSIDKGLMIQSIIGWALFGAMLTLYITNH